MNLLRRIFLLLRRIFLFHIFGDEGPLIEPILISHTRAQREGGVDNWEQARQDYWVLKEWFRMQANYEAEDEMLYWARICETKTKSFLGQCCFYFLKNLFGFGIRFKPVIITMITVIITCALMYAIAGSIGLLNYNGSEPKNLIDLFVNSLYLSFITYTTVGFGDISPLDGFRFVTMIEGLSGVILNAWLIAMLARRLFR